MSEMLPMIAACCLFGNNGLASDLENRITHFMIKVKHFMKENALLNALYMVSQQSIPRTFYRLIFR